MVCANERSLSFGYSTSEPLGPPSVKELKCTLTNTAAPFLLAVSLRCCTSREMSVERVRMALTSSCWSRLRRRSDTASVASFSISPLLGAIAPGSNGMSGCAGLTAPPWPGSMTTTSGWGADAAWACAVGEAAITAAVRTGTLSRTWRRRVAGRRMATTSIWRREIVSRGRAMTLRSLSSPTLRS